MGELRVVFALGFEGTRSGSLQEVAENPAGEGPVLSVPDRQPVDVRVVRDPGKLPHLDLVLEGLHADPRAERSPVDVELKHHVGHRVVAQVFAGFQAGLASYVAFQRASRLLVRGGGIEADPVQVRRQRVLDRVDHRRFARAVVAREECRLPYRDGRVVEEVPPDQAHPAQRDHSPPPSASGAVSLLMKERISSTPSWSRDRARLG